MNPHQRRLLIEALEERYLLSITVNTLVDELDGSILDGDVSLRDAISIATPGETIDFDPSLSGGAIDLVLGELAITRSLTIDASSLASLVTLDAKQRSRVLNVNDGNVANLLDVTFDGLKITGGRTTASSDDGGGIRSLENLTIVNSTITGNTTLGYWAKGGGISQRIGNLLIIDSEVSGNSTHGDFAYGGGLDIRSGDGTITNSRFSDNSTAGRNAYGGGITVVNSRLDLSSSIIADNFTTGRNAFGGGVNAKRGDLTVSSSTISNNRANFSGADAGGLYGGASLVVTDSIIAGNSSSDDGGGIFGEGDVTIINSLLFGNYTFGIDTFGGGIAAKGNVMIVDSTLAYNSSAGFFYHGATIGGGAVKGHDVTVAQRTVCRQLLSGGWWRYLRAT